MDDASITEGTVLAGKYRVERVLGRGGMGVVVAARHLHLGQRVALKFLLPEAYGVPGAVERFIREARSVVRIQSEHVARVSDVGTLESGAPYIVMEYLQGSDLSELLRTRGPFPESDAIDYLLQACEAIAEAHALGIVHRDLKPANLFLTQRTDGSALVKVLDFGIAKAVELDPTTGAPVSMTRTSAIMGSPLYLSPEQFRNSKDVDARSDIWALGVTLFELLTGSTVYTADSAPALLAMIVADPPATLRSRLPKAPAELESVLLRCLEKDRARRYSSVAELAQALQRFGSPAARISADRISRVLGETTTVSVEIAPAGIDSATPSLGQSGGTPAWGYTQGSRGRKWAGPLLALGVLALVGLGIASLISNWRSRNGVAVAPDDRIAVQARQPSAASAIPAAEVVPATPIIAQVVASPTPNAFASTPVHAPAPLPAKAAPARLRSTGPTAAPTKARANLDPFDDTH